MTKSAAEYLAGGNEAALPVAARQKPKGNGVKRSLLSVAVAGAYCSVLSGCAAMPEPEPQIIIKTVEVKIPAPVPCRIDPIPKPAFALDAAKTSQGLYLKGAAALAEINQRKAYEAKLEAAVASCQ